MAVEREIEIDLEIKKQDGDREIRAFLTLTTSKSKFSGTLDSTAMVSWKGNGFRQYQLGFGAGADFYRSLERSRGVRATQGNIDRQHNRVFTKDQIVNLTSMAKSYYAGFAQQAA